LCNILFIESLSLNLIHL